MAGPGGGPPRRSHTKSRKGCESCKRRHIRCDENFPQCRNCTKHKITCPYREMQVPDADPSFVPDSQQVQAVIAKWQETGEPPFPCLHVSPASWIQAYSTADLNLIYHVAALFEKLHNVDANNFTIWTRHIPTVLSIGATYPFVMHALLAFSAMHIAYLTDNHAMDNVALKYRGIALSGLHDAITSFSRETADAILAASLVLSWQAADWGSWTQHMQGTSAVIEAMDGWKHESQFTEFIAERNTFPTAPPSPVPDHRPVQPHPDDIATFKRMLEKLTRLEMHLMSHSEETVQLNMLINFLKEIERMPPKLSIAEQFAFLQPLRTWLFWMPVDYLPNFRNSPNSLVVIAHLYSVVLVMERIFPEVGAAYFGSLCAGPIEEIGRFLISNELGNPIGIYQMPLALMDLPNEMVLEFRARNGTQRISPLPGTSPVPFRQFRPPNLHISQAQSYMPYGNPAFSYSGEEMSMLNGMGTSPREAISPGFQSSPFPGQQYLNIPSPSFGGAYSPDSLVYYSDGEEQGLYDTPGLLPGPYSKFEDTHQNSYGVGSSASSTQPPLQEPSFATSWAGAPSPLLYPESAGMLPLPESPVPSISRAYASHSQTPSMSSGPLHPPSPLLLFQTQFSTSPPGTPGTSYSGFR